VSPQGLLEETEPSQWKLPRRRKAKRRNTLRFSALRLLLDPLHDVAALMRLIVIAAMVSP
jgi:hypothetical protein